MVKNLHKSTIKMLLFASAMNNETAPINLSESLICFINSKTVALTKQELNHQVEHRRMTKVSFPMGYTANMYLNTLLWSSSDTPSNHPPFSFLEADPLQMEEDKNCHLMLQLILTQAKEMTLNEIKASNKQEVHAPMNFHDMAEQLNMFMIANYIFSLQTQCWVPMSQISPDPASKQENSLTENSHPNSSLQLTQDTKFGSINARFQ
jgi:hypothetical protein